MRLCLEIPWLTVRDRDDRKGSPVTTVEVFGRPVLFAPGHQAKDLDYWEDIIQRWLGSLLADYIISTAGEGCPWEKESPTGREVSRSDEHDFG